MGDPQKRYPPELKERAVRMVLEARAADPNDHNAIHAHRPAARCRGGVTAQLVEADPHRLGRAPRDDDRRAQADH